MLTNISGPFEYDITAELTKEIDEECERKLKSGSATLVIEEE